ncbi:UNVERIFIED_CONTAM: hypothetical protein Scaly_1857500 [Sesamum calycinum]|uniref:Uncharacterized protein n=1 Tax=Sesamum calycinum TaxID=2727403 RepID=A0AAW2NGF4_9LAMI
MIPNLKKLKVVYTCESCHYELNNSVHLHQLETLNLKFQGDTQPVSFGIPHNLKKLTLSGCGLSWNDMTHIGFLPNLEVLKLLSWSVRGTEWEPVQGEFVWLKFLQMEWLDIKHWTAESNHFQRLQHLNKRHCWALENIPSEIGDIPTLQVIEVGDADSAERILQEQRDIGIDVLYENNILDQSGSSEFVLFIKKQYEESHGDIHDHHACIFPCNNAMQRRSIDLPRFTIKEPIMAANTVMATFLILMFVYSPALMPCDADRLTLQANNLRSIVSTLVVFAFVLSPILPTCDASRVTVVQEVLATRPICPACVCCEPPPPGSCCRCCASPSPSPSSPRTGSHDRCDHSLHSE